MPESGLSIALVVDRFGARYGGAESYGVSLAREMQAQGHRVTVLAREYDPDCGVRLPYVALSSWSGWPSWIRVLLFALRARRHTAGRYDIVHSHMNGWCGDVEVVHVTPVRYQWRVRPLPWHKRLLSRVSLRVQTYLGLESRRVRPRRGHRTVAVSGLIAEQLSQAYAGLPAPAIIAPGVYAPGPADPADRVSVRRDCGWSDADFVCLLVARNPQRKGLATVLEALAGLPDRVRLLVVGGNDATREFVARTAKAGVVARVRILDATPDVARYYRAADIYVHPTLNDSFGMAPLEAMSHGLPVIVSPTPWCGFAQYVQPEREALVLEHPQDATGLAQYIARLEADAALRKGLADAGRLVAARHHWSRIAQQYLDLYQAVLAERV